MLHYDFLGFVQDCEDLLAIKLPVEIRFRPHTKGKYYGKLAAFCEGVYRKGKLIKHRLILNRDIMLESQYFVNDTIAHELIHAKMIENRSINWNRPHNKKFQKLAQDLRIDLAGLGYMIENIFDPDTDTD